MQHHPRGRFSASRRLPLPPRLDPHTPLDSERDVTGKPPSPSRRRRKPALRFTPYAWAKWQYLRDLGDTEIACFGLSAEHDPLRIVELAMVKQKATAVSVAFDDEAIADYFDHQCDAGLPVERFFRTWLHTHPGHSAEPSGLDEETFARVFGDCHWSVMGILAHGGQRYARLRFGVGPGGEGTIPVKVDYSAAFPAADPVAWRAEYDRCVQRVPEAHALVGFDPSWLDDPEGLAPFAIDDEALALIEQGQDGGDEGEMDAMVEREADPDAAPGACDTA